MVIKHLGDAGEFYADINGLRAFVRYILHEGSLDITETRVPKELRGKGIAAALVKEVYDYASSQNLNCLATCSYAMAWLERHPEYNGRASAAYQEGSCQV